MIIRAFFKIWLLPPMFNILLILLGLWLMRRWRRMGLGLIIISCLWLYLFSTQWFSTLLLKSVEAHPVLRYDEHAALQAQLTSQPTAIVMLGSSNRNFAVEYGAAQLDEQAVLRANYTVWLAKALDLPVLVTGGIGSANDKPHAHVVAEYTSEHLDFEIRWQETAARTTYDNAALSRNLLAAENIDRIILVTQSYHMRRAVELFKAQGFNVIPAPIALSGSLNIANAKAWLPNIGSFKISYRASHEIIGWWWYSIKGFD